MTSRIDPQGNTLTFIWNSGGQFTHIRDSLHQATILSLSVDQLSYVPSDRFDRANLISKISKGDKDAAFQLATFYNRERLPEAAFYWFGVAIKLGHEGMSKESLEFYEHSIIGEFNSGPDPSE